MSAESTSAAIEAAFHKILLQVRALQEEMRGPAAAYEAIVARAAQGEDVPEGEWLAAEEDIKALTRRALRLRVVLQHQQRTMETINAAMSKRLAQQLAKELAFLNLPVVGHA